jgi:hypothetical protein
MRNVTVRQAINTGLKRAHIAFVGTFMAGLAVLFGLQVYFQWHFLLFIILTALPSAAAFYVNRLISYQWQIWSLEYVDDAHELKRLAIKRGMIWDWEDSIFQPTNAQKKRLAKLNERFSTPDTRIPTAATPETVEIYYSKTYNKYQLVGWTLGLLFFSFLVVLFFVEDQLAGETGFLITVGIFWLFTLLMVIENISQLLDTEPVVTFCPEGLRIKKRLLEKSDIIDIVFSRGKNGHGFSVKFRNFPIGFNQDVDDLEMDSETMEDVASVFMKRWNGVQE